MEYGRTIRGNAPSLLSGVAGKAGLILLIVLALGTFSCSVTSVPAGHIGVLTLFGRVTGEMLPEGMHVINPFKQSNVMSIRTQELKEAANVPSGEGLIMTLEVSLLYRLDPSHAAEVYQKIGPNYQEVVVVPNLRSAVRSITAAHTANALYSSGREQLAEQIEKELGEALTARGVVTERVLLRDIQLPPTLKIAIEAKQQADQDAQRMQFVLLKEKQEAERKRIEAQGIADFQKTVAQGISEQLLVWKGIEATEKLAASSNAKIVIIGNTKNGLPLVLEPTR